MKHLYLSAAALLIAGAALYSQQPIGVSPTAMEWNYSGQAAPAVAPAAPCCGPATQKICVTEPEKRTQVVYGSKCEEFCIKKCPLFGLFHKSSECDCQCCQMRTRKVLVKKIVPDCDGVKCVVKEVPVECAAPCGAINVAPAVPVPPAAPKAPAAPARVTATSPPMDISAYPYPYPYQYTSGASQPNRMPQR